MADTHAAAPPRPSSPIAARSPPASSSPSIMQALDTTIANVALPYMQGSVSASADQINWVLTSYIVAAAIMTPPSGFLAQRFGRKRVLLVAIAGFVVASVLCGIGAVADRDRRLPPAAGPVRRGAGAAVAGILLDIYTPEERGSAMALFGVSVMVGPVLGPVIGGWLTDNISAGAGCSTSTCRSARWPSPASCSSSTETKRDTCGRSSTGSASARSASPSPRCSSSSTAASSSTGSPPARS